MPGAVQISDDKPPMSARVKNVVTRMWHDYRVRRNYAKELRNGRSNGIAESGGHELPEQPVVTMHKQRHEVKDSKRSIDDAPAPTTQAEKQEKRAKKLAKSNGGLTSSSDRG